MTRRAADLLPAVALCAAAELEVASEGLGWVAAALVALATLPFALRRRLPAAPFLAAGVLVPAVELAVGDAWLEPANAPIWILLAAAWVLGRAPLRVAVPALAACVALSGGEEPGFLVVLIGLPWLCARAVLAHRERAAELRVLAARLEDERAMSERLGVARERERMAREVHDAIAHAVGGMVLQAAGAEQMIETDPGRAGAALAAVQSTGREAIGELRCALGILRAEDPPPPPPPEPRRWRAPWPAAAPLSLAALCVAVVVYVATGAPLAAAVPVLAATYAVAATAGRRGAAAGALLGVGVPPALELASGSGTGDALIPLAFMALPWLAGRAVAAQRRRAAELTELTAQLRGERDARMRLAALEERARVARELHDSVAHSVSVMVLQAGAAAEVLNRDGSRSLEAIRAVQDVGRAAIRELRQLVGDRERPIEPHAGLAGLPALLDAARAAGLPVTFRDEGPAEPLAPGVDAAAFRVVQEAITNAIRHAGAAPTTVTIQRGPAGLHIEVADEGPVTSATGPGHGLAGMRERVARHGGELHAGPRPGGRGFVVSADLPVERVPA